MSDLLEEIVEGEDLVHGGHIELHHHYMEMCKCDH